MIDCLNSPFIIMEKMNENYGNTKTNRYNIEHTMKSLFRRKGILNKVEAFMKSQLIAEFQNNCSYSIKSTSTVDKFSPISQALRLLIADSLLQEDLLFTLSVYTKEVQHLPNLMYSSQSLKDGTCLSSTRKYKFAKNDISSLTNALQFNLNDNEVSSLFNIYNTGNQPLLSCILATISNLIQKYRKTTKALKRIKKSKTTLCKLYHNEISKTKRMYNAVEDAHNIVFKYKHEIEDLRQRCKTAISFSNDLKNKSAKLLTKETELVTWHKSLELKENNLKKTYSNRINEVEEKMKFLEKRDLEIQNRNQMILNEKEDLRIERDRLEHCRNKIHEGDVETKRIVELEQKFHQLQSKIGEILNNNTISLTSEQFHQNLEHQIATNQNVTKINAFGAENSLNNFLQLSVNMEYLKQKLHNLENKTNNHNAKSYQKLHQRLPTESCIPTFCEIKVGEFHTEEIVEHAKIKVQRLEEESKTLNRHFKSLQHVLDRNIKLSESKLNSSSSSNTDTTARSSCSNFSNLCSHSTSINNEENGTNCRDQPPNLNKFRGMFKKFKENQKQKSTSFESTTSSSTPRKLESNTEKEIERLSIEQSLEIDINDGEKTSYNTSKIYDEFGNDKSSNKVENSNLNPPSTEEHLSGKSDIAISVCSNESMKDLDFWS